MLSLAEMEFVKNVKDRNTITNDRTQKDGIMEASLL